jgi:rubrerythrin
MGIEFNAEEAFVLAEQVELKAARFYLDAADNSANESIRRLFKDLARMETDHVQVFSALRTLTASRAPQPDAAPPAGQAPRLPADLWPVLAGGMVQGLQQELPGFFDGKKTSADILRAAMDFERDTIVFLVGMKNMLSVQAEKDRIDTIILEEVGHLLQLAGQLANL